MKKIFNLVLLMTLMFIGIGSTFNNVDALAGGNNQTIILENIVENGDFNIGTIWTLETGTSISGGELIYNSVNHSDRAYQNILTIDNVIFITYEIVDFTSGIVTVDGGYNVGTGRSSLGIFNELIIVEGTSDLNIRSRENGTTLKLDNVMVFDLTVIYGEGNEPTLEEFELILEDAPEYFEEWYYNGYIEDASIGEFACERTATNLIENGDFSLDLNSDGLGDDWSFPIELNSSYSITNNIQTFYNEITGSAYVSSLRTKEFNYTIDNDSVLYFRAQNIYNIDRIVLKAEFLRHLDGTPITNITTSSYSGLFNTYGSSTTNNFLVFYKDDYFVNSTLSNVLFFNLTELYGKNNEPSIEEWEAILEANGVDDYTDEFTFDDTCYMTVEQNNPIYQYETYIYGQEAEIDITLTETILEMDDINPLLYIAKYDLEMNFEGIIYDGNITSSSVNTEGYVEHSFTYYLPSPDASEDGYIYIAYDKNGGEILSGGYVFDGVSDEFRSPFSDEEGLQVRTSNNAIAINGSPYLDLESEYQFNDIEFSDYMFNDNDNFMIIHSRVIDSYYGGAELEFYSENTSQESSIDFAVVYGDFCDRAYLHPTPDIYECYFYVSEDNSLPPLFDYLNSNNIYDSYLIGAIDEYELNYTEFLIDVGYADNLGVYTYKLDSVSGRLAVGETPIYYFDYFHDMEIVNHAIRNGRSAFIDIYKDTNYLDDVMTYQYLYDNNTGIYEFDINDNTDQRITMEVFDGLTPDDATVYYHVRNILGDYNNNASEYAYDIYMSDSYVLTEAEPFPDKVDGWMDMLNMNSVLGKLIVSAVLLILATVGVFLFSRNVIAVLFVDFALIALLAVLGIIPLWIILFVIMLFFGGLFIKNRGGGGAE